MDYDNAIVLSQVERLNKAFDVTFDGFTDSSGKVVFRLVDRSKYFNTTGDMVDFVKKAFGYVSAKTDHHLIRTNSKPKK